MRLIVLTVALLVAACVTRGDLAPTAAPATGDRWSYQKLNAYNGQLKAEVRYEVVDVTNGHVEVAVGDRRERYPLRWSEFELVDGDRFIFPLPDTGKARVVALNPETQRILPITVYSRLSGSQKVAVPAGEFDARKISREIYVDDREWYKSQTVVRQREWYATSVSQPVMRESQASYRDLRRSRHDGLIEGDWNRWVLAGR
jgi:hypothetical protein